MAGFHTKTFIKHDDYMTPKHAWENIKQYIPNDKVIWEAFYGDGKSGTYLEELGFDVIHEPINFFEENRGDIIVSNPPFSLSKEVMNRLYVLDKPFIILFPSSKINTAYFRKWKDNNIQIIIPRTRINFNKLVNGKEVKTKGCNFDCFYYCYKMNLPNDIIWLENDIEKIIKNKDKIIEKIPCDICGSVVKKYNLNKHKKSKKCINYINNYIKKYIPIV